MKKDILIDSAHSEEVRTALVVDGKLDKFDFETRLKTQVKGNVYLAKVIRIEPSLQAVFVDYGGNRHGFLSFSEIHHDYFQIPVDDRQELETHIQNAIAAHVAETGQSEEEIDQREISKLRYQFYRRYKVQEVIKKRQIMLIQVTKEERGNKGAAVTTYISLAGRYCVLMPNTPKGSGVSRKITNHKDRTKLKKIVTGLNIENGSVVIRTAGIGHTKTEITKDFNYLVGIWNEIRETTLKSTAPCLIHEEANVIKRAIRDMYTKEVDSVLVEGEEGYKIAKAFMKGLMPSHARKVKLYDDKNAPLFSKYKLNEQINQIYSTRVDLPSGGYLIINTTEALIAIDVNSGKSIRERNIAETALKTNLEAAVEVARQCRLRDLAGLVVVDFIDMEERKDNIQVEKCLREALKNDKAKIQLCPISNLGLLEFSRQRLRASIADANTVICPHCRGTGFMWSDESMALQVLRKIEEACGVPEFKEICVHLPSGIAIYILNNKRSFISEIEARGNLKISFKIDNSIAAADFRIEQILKPVITHTDDDEEVDSPKEKVEIQNKEKAETSKNQRKKANSTKKDWKKNSEEQSEISLEENTKKEIETPPTKNLEERPQQKKPIKIRRFKSDKISIKKTPESSNVEENTAVISEQKPGDLKPSEEPEIKEGKVDIDTTIQLDEYRKEMAVKVAQSYMDPGIANDIPNDILKRKKRGWWQKLLKKPEEDQN